jgi:hypothetical protein
MIDRALAEPLDRDYLVSPVIFDDRQFIELSLKYKLAIYGPTVGVDLHPPTLQDVMNGVAGYFTGTDGFLADLNVAGP